MAHSLPRLSKSLLDSPQLITESKFREIAEVLENRDSSFIQAALVDPDEKRKVVASLEKDVGETIGVLRIEGPLTYKPTGWEALCGGCSYVGLIDQMQTFADSGIKTVAMMVDSPGGQAFRAFSTSRKLKSIAEENGISLKGYIDGQACSAGYALASVCDELVSHSDSSSGSIGVVISLTNTSERDRKEGIQRQFITAGSSKVPYDNDGDFKEEFLEDLQSKINKTYDNFVNHVADMRGLDSQAVRDTEAKVFDAEEALSLGLIDKIMEEDEFLEYISSTSGATLVSAQQLRDREKDYEEMNVVETQPNLENEKETTLMTDVTITPEMYAELEAKLKSQSAQLESYIAKEAEAKEAALSEQLDTLPFLAECKEDMMNFFLSANEEHTSLMNTVLDAAKAENDKVMEEAASQIAEKDEELSVMEEALKEAKTEVETAKEEALKVKEEFGKQEAIEGTPKDKTLDADATSGAARTAKLAQIVKQKQAK